MMSTGSRMCEAALTKAVRMAVGATSEFVGVTEVSSRSR